MSSIVYFPLSDLCPHCGEKLKKYNDYMNSNNIEFICWRNRGEVRPWIWEDVNFVVEVNVINYKYEFYRIAYINKKYKILWFPNKNKTMFAWHGDSWTCFDFLIDFENFMDEQQVKNKINTILLLQ